MAQEIIIDGNKFSNLAEFYDETERKFTKGLDWKTGRNLDAFNDVMRGGFGVFDYGSSIKIRWKNSAKSMTDLGKSETLKYYRTMLKKCHPSNVPYVTRDMNEVKRGKGEILFDKIVNIIREHEHIELVLE